METAKESKQSRKSKVGFIFVPILCAILLVCFYGIVTTQIEISNKKAQLEVIAEHQKQVEDENAVLYRYSNDEYKSEYFEEIARNELGYAKPNEKIYYIVPSKD